MSPIVIDERPRCPTCGHVVYVQSFPDGMTFYEPDEADQQAVIDSLETALRDCQEPDAGYAGLTGHRP